MAVILVLTKWFNNVKLIINLMALNHQGVYVVVDYKLGIMETRFAELIWNREPITSGELVKLCERELEWKKSTTYTMLRRLCQRNIFQNKDGMVTAILSKQEFQALQSEMFIEETFSGSLPQFLTAFAGRKKLTDTEINELQRLIDQNRRWHDD